MTNTKENKPRAKNQPINEELFIAACKKAEDREEVLEKMDISVRTFQRYYKKNRNLGKIPEIDGRIVIDEAKIGELKEYFAKGYNKLNACYKANIHYDTLAKYCKRNPDFQREIEILQETPYDLAKDIIQEELELKNVDIAKMVWKEQKQNDRARKFGEGLGKTASEGVQVQVNFID